MPPGSESRRHIRRKVSTEGRIVFADGMMFDCKIKDISETGALLVLPDEMEMPFDFKLVIGNNGMVQRVCYLVRQDGRRVGVRFPNR